MTEEEKMLLRQTIISNQHEICVISLESIDELINEYKGETKQYLQKIAKKAVGFTVGYGANVMDAKALAILLGDLGGAGRFYIKEYGGKPHIILKGYPGLRKILTGTKYGVNNTKIVRMGLGKAGAISAAKGGGILSILLITPYRIVEHCLSDESTLTHLIGTLATDVVKIGIATAASFAAGVFIAGVTTFAIDPIAAVFIIGLAVNYALGELDNHYAITDKVIQKLEEINHGAEYISNQLVPDMKNAFNKAVDSAVDSAIDWGIDAAERKAQEFLDRLNSPFPRF